VLLKRSSFIVLSACLLLAQACRQKSETLPDLTLTHEISPQPPRMGQVTITLRITDGSGGQVAGARIGLEANMAHAGMSPVFAEASETGDGSYRASMDLTMAGDWFVLIHATLPDGRKLERQFEIKGVAPA
jgi:hypothetical protein